MHLCASHALAHLKLTWQAQDAARQVLEDRGLAEFEAPRCGSADVRLIRLTSKGWSTIGRDPPHGQGGGDIAHQHITHWIAMVAESDGLEARCEMDLGGHRVDCAVKAPGNLWDAHEAIVNCEDNLLSHLTTLSGCPSVRTITVVCLQKRTVERLRRQLASASVVQELGDRLRWDIASTYLRRLWP